MSRSTMGVGVALLGILIVAVSLFADSLGIGAQPGVVGWKQILGAGGGLLLGLLGGFLIVTGRGEGDD